MVTLDDADLTRFRYHIGATPRRLATAEPCPLLFRDIGPAAMRRFLRGELRRLAGPTSPILYLRSAAYREPYTDYEPIGRLVLLQPERFRPWHSGVPTVFVARVEHCVDTELVGFVPGYVPLENAAQQLAGVSNTSELREVFGGRAHDELRSETADRLARLELEIAEVERLAEPIRRRLQSGRREVIEQVRSWLESVGVTEHDLCAAWHHVPRERREMLKAVLPSRPDSWSRNDERAR